MAHTKADFDDAAERLLGPLYRPLKNQGMSRSALCVEIARREFTGATLPGPKKDSDLQLVREVATDLWHRGGNVELLN